MRAGQDERITHLFRRGYSLDLVSEIGLLYGWTREEAKAVLAAKGWALDYSGRLQARYAKTAITSPSVANADPERLLNAGVDHENPDVRRAASNAERALEKLRNALMRQEQKDSELAAQHQKAAEVLSEAFGAALEGLGPVGQARAS